MIDDCQLPAGRTRAFCRAGRDQLPRGRGRDRTGTLPPIDSRGVTLSGALLFSHRLPLLAARMGRDQVAVFAGPWVAWASPCYVPASPSPQSLIGTLPSSLSRGSFPAFCLAAGAVLPHGCWHGAPPPALIFPILLLEFIPKQCQFCRSTGLAQGWALPARAARCWPAKLDRFFDPRPPPILSGG